LADKQVSFKVADLPELNTLTLGIFASLAQYERELISQRTSAVLQDKKRRGEKLGNPENLTYDAKVKGAAANKAKAEANANNIKATGYIVSLRDNENLTWNAIAKKLNNEGFETPKGKAKAFRAETVKRLYNRAKQ
jgi:DNA invertase Pin-like site-specific DNA recombinase